MTAGATLATVLFTDVVGSTELRARMGDAAADDLRRHHDGILGEVVAAHGGVVVKGTGDGILATFAGAAEAVDAAVAMQQATAADGPRSGVTLTIRIGISAGDVAWDDGDCFGTPVVEAARICAEAAAGQILCSAPVEWLARGRTDRRFVSAGERDLKGLPEPVPVSEVPWEAIAAEPLVPLPTSLQPPERYFVGREEERAVIERAWRDTEAGALRLVLLSGEPGVGKTRLSAEAATAASGEGAVVLFGRCDEDLGVPYQPFVEAMRSFVAAVPDGRVQGLLGPGAPELARLAPELTRRWGTAPASTTDPATERYRLFEAVAGWLSALSQEAPVLLVLDDLHWAGKPTTLLLRHLVRSPLPMRLLVLGTYRDTDLARTHPLAEALADLRREPAVQRLDLAGLDPSAIEAFLALAAGHELGPLGSTLAAALHRETDGNPFFLREVVRHLVEAGSVFQRDGVWQTSVPIDQLPIPEGIREVVGRRLSRLSEAANIALAWGAVMGAEFELAVLGAVVDLEDEKLLSGLEEAIGAGLVAEQPGRDIRYRFSHALVRSTLYEELPTARRVRMHRKVGEAIEAVHPGRLERYLPDLAHHWAEAAAGGDVAKAVEYAVQAAASATRQAAHDQAVHHLRAAVSMDELADEPQPATRRIDLLLALGDAQKVAGHPDRRATLLRAATLAEEIGDDGRVAAALLMNNRGTYSQHGLVDREYVDMLRRAVVRRPQGDDATTLQLMAVLAAELTFSRREREEARAMSDDAMAMARRIGDRASLAAALLLREPLFTDVRPARERDVEASDLWALVEGGDDATLLKSRWNRFVSALEAGQVGVARSVCTQLWEAAERSRIPFYRGAVRGMASTLASLRGDLDEADALLAAADPLIGSDFPEWPLMRVTLQFPIELERGTADRLIAPAEEVERAAPGIFTAAFGILHLATNDLEALRRYRDAVKADPHHGQTLPARLGQYTYCLIASVLDDAELAAQMYDALLPRAGELVVSAAGNYIGAADTALGAAAAVVGDHVAAAGHFQAADQLLAWMGAPLVRARSGLEWANACRRAGRLRDAERLGERALLEAVRRDLPGLRADAERVLETL